MYTHLGSRLTGATGTVAAEKERPGIAVQPMVVLSHCQKHDRF